MNTSKLSVILVVPLLFLAFSVGCARRAPRPAPTPGAPTPATPTPPAPIPPTLPTPTPTPTVPSDAGEAPPGKVVMIPSLEDIHFDFDRYHIRSDVRVILEQNGRWLRENPRAKVQIEGHCDEQGTVEYNLALGEKRANSTRDYLISLGIEPHRLSTISYGEEKPLDPSHNEEAWAINRRAHFHKLSE